MNVGIFRPQGMGDGLLLAPALRAMREGGEAGRTHLWCNPDAGYLLQSMGLCDSFHDHNKSLRSSPYPLDVFVGFSFEHEILQFMGGGFAPQVTSVHFTAPTGVHMARYNYDVIDRAGVVMGPYRVDPVQAPISPDDTSRPDVLLYPSASSKDKRWPMDRWDGLAGRLIEDGFDVAFIEPPADNYGEPWGIPLHTRPVLGMVDMMRHCLLWIGNDTGPTHLAALLGAPVLALFGSSQPHTWHPLGTAQWLQTCERMTRTRLPIFCSGHDCYAGMDVSMVYDAARSMLPAP